MSVEEFVMPKKERSKTHHGAPRNPEMVLQIINGRDKQNKTWQALGDEFNITRAGARHLYNRWYGWSKETEEKLAG